MSCIVRGIVRMLLLLLFCCGQLCAKIITFKGLSQPLPSMTLKLLIKHGEANSYCFTVSCVPEGMFNCLE